MRPKALPVRVRRPGFNFRCTRFDGHGRPRAATDRHDRSNRETVSASPQGVRPGIVNKNTTSVCQYAAQKGHRTYGPRTAGDPTLLPLVCHHPDEQGGATPLKLQVYDIRLGHQNRKRFDIVEMGTVLVDIEKNVADTDPSPLGR